MKKMKRIAAMTAALLICSGVMGYMPAEMLKIGGFATNAAGDSVAESVEINETNFPDEIFRKYVAENCDTDGDGVLSAEEISDVTAIGVRIKNISDLTGIAYFKKLKTLHCNNNNLTELDLSNNTALEYLSCNSNPLTSLDFSDNVALRILDCGSCHLVSLDIRNNVALTELDCSYNQLTSLDISNNTALKTFNCRNNQLNSLDVSNNTALTELVCASNQLTSLDVNDKALTNLYCGDNQLTTLDISNNTALEYLDCNKNKFITLDLSKNTKLKYLVCSENSLTSLDLSNNTSFRLYSTEWYPAMCELNKYEIVLKNNTFDLATLPAGFDVTKASEWTNGAVNGNILTVEDASKEVTYKYDCGHKEIDVFATFTLIPTTSTETPEKPPVSAPTVSLGDISGDGSIDSSDATLVLSDYAVIATGGKSTFTAEQAKAADVDGDGKYDSIDASIILAYYAYTSTGGTGTLEEYLNS